MQKKIILHIDFDSFFASVEQQENPLLRNRPVGVVATNGRTCIIAASREAKAKGVKSPSRTFDAQKICPSIVFVPAHFPRYWEISKKFIAICSDYSPYIEIFSLDEVFIDVSSTVNLFGGVYPLIDKIRSRLREELGEYITASFGISHNKLLSKLASGMKKPDGIFEIKEDQVMKVYQDTKLTDICGIGSRIEARLNNMGIYTLHKLKNTRLEALIAEFGEAEGHFLKNVGQGIDTRPIINYTEAPSVKSVGRNYCLAQNEYDKRVVLQNVFELCEEIGIKLRRLNKKARTVGIYLRGDEDLHARKTYSTYMDQGREIFKGINNSFALDTPDTIGTFDTLGYVRQIGVWASNLKDSDKIPASIFETEKHQKLWRAIDRINEKFGDHTIRNGFLLYADKLTTVPNGFMADRYERVKLANENL